MLKNKESIIAVIPARGGSKGIPRKNIKSFFGRPLVEWTIEVAVKSNCFNHVVVSTDDQDIQQVAQASGASVPFLRPKELSGDDVATAPVVAHAVAEVERIQGKTYNYVFILEPTSPTRREAHIVDAARLLIDSGADSLAAISSVPHHYRPGKLISFDPFEMSITGMNGEPISSMRHRRQGLVDYYSFNGLIWACRRSLLQRNPPTIWGEKTMGYKIESKYCCDLDSPEDWVPMEARMQEILLSK